MQWFKIHHGFSTNKKLALIAFEAKLPKAIINAIVIDMIEYASSCPDRGNLQGYDLELSSFNLGISQDELVTVRNALLKKKFIFDEKIANWDEYQSIDKTNAERQARFRNKKKQEVSNTIVTEVTEVTRYAPLCNTEEKRGEEIREDKKEIYKEKFSDLENPPSIQKKYKGSRFELTELPSEWIEFCQTQRPDLNVGLVFDGFRDYWIAKAGKDGIKLDWTATWRNWIRRQNKQTEGKNNEQPKKSTIDIIREGTLAARAARELRSQEQT